MFESNDISAIDRKTEFIFDKYVSLLKHALDENI